MEEARNRGTSLLNVPVVERDALSQKTIPIVTAVRTAEDVLKPPPRTVCN
jgi:hypothetical protein